MRKNNYVDSFNKKTLKLGVKEKISAAVGALVLVAGYFMFFHVDKTPYGYVDIPDKLDEYLKESSYYSSAYKSGKMVVFFYSDKDDTYKYEKTFKDNIERVQLIDKISNLYEFVNFRRLRNNILMEDDGEKILKGEKLLKKTCRKFCIMNPKKKSLYFYFEPRPRDSQYLEGNLEKLEFWGIQPD